MRDKLGRFTKGFTPWNKGKPFEQLRGKNNPRWNGGRKVNSQGYILISNPSHPFCDKQGYVREHRLVMEKKLGRYLKPKEIVHHKGIEFPLGSTENKQDNRIKNLGLFSCNAKHIKDCLIKTFRNKTHKQCTHCFVTKPRSEFSPQKPKSENSSHSDPHHCWCKKCCAEHRYKKSTSHSQIGHQ